MSRPFAALALLVLSSPQDLSTLVARWRAHYAAVERELAEACPAELSPQQRAARSGALDVLAAYRERGAFTRQELEPGALVPQFVDRAGRRCAVAELLHADGRDALVERVRVTHNTAWVSELAADAEFRAWLAHSGFSLADAARIQTPAYGGYCGPCDSVPPGGVTERPEDSGPRKERPSAPTGSPPSAPGALPQTTTSFATEERRPEDAWWTWWELNKLEYLDEYGLEQRLERDAGRTSAEVAQMTEPLRAARQRLLFEELHSADAQIRAAAALASGRIARAAAVEPLSALLSDSSQRVREHALFGLGASGSSAGAHLLLGLLERGGRSFGNQDELELVTPRALPLAILALAVGRRAGMDPGVASAVALLAPRVEEAQRPRALWAACLFQRIAPDPALEALCLRLAGEREQVDAVRAAALEALGTSTDPRALARLQDALFGRELELRRSAALALGRSPQAAATGALLTAHDLEAEPLARGFVLLSLGLRGGPLARDVLLETLAHGSLASEPWAALGLGLHARVSRDPSIVRALLAAAPVVRNEDSRPAVLLALGLAQEPRAAALARAALEHGASPRERGYAATTLALLGGAANRAWLRERFALERSGFVRASLAQGLAVLGDASDVPTLFAALRGLAERDLQAVTAAALGQLGSAAALSGLDELVVSGDSALVRATALDALGVLLERGEPLVLPDASRGANFALYEDWAFELFLLAL